MTYRNHLSPPVFPYSWASEWGEDHDGLWVALVYKYVRVVFRWIEPGSFMMGSPETEESRDGDEDLHQVTLTQGFWLAETTVTQALWQVVMDKNPSEFQQGDTDDYPVETVSWDDAQNFITTLNRLHPDLTLRLPWEAEWEYACRAGTQTSFNLKGELSLDKVNYRGTWDDYEIWGEGARQKTAKVKSYPCNAWGLYEMHGNVWEWCQDSWQYDLGNEAVEDPKPEGVGGLRVIRGGSWYDHGGRVRSAIRDRDTPDDQLSFVGFRLLLGH